MADSGSEWDSGSGNGSGSEVMVLIVIEFLPAPSERSHGLSTKPKIVYRTKRQKTCAHVSSCRFFYKDF